MVDNLELELLKAKLEKLNKHNLIKIFSIIYHNEEEKNYNIKNNSVFIALNLLKQSTIDKINIHINKINHNDVLNNFMKNN